MNRFFAYEEYGAKYEMMAQDMAATYNSIPGWHAYERGIEALANSLTSMNGREAHSRKGLTFNDLLIKVLPKRSRPALSTLMETHSRYKGSASIRCCSWIYTNTLR